MLDFNMIEIVILGAMAIIFFGPERLPEFARKTARVMAYLRQIGNDARGQLRQELGPEFDDIRLSDLNPRNLISRHLLSGDEVADLRQIRDDALETGALVRETIPDVDQSLATAKPGASSAVPDSSRVGGRVAFDPEST